MKTETLFLRSFALAALICITAVIPFSASSRACPLVVLLNPPTTVKVCNKPCNATTTLCKSCSQTFTLNTGTTCQPFTWTFINTTQNCTTAFVTATANLTVNSLPGANNDAYTLNITDNLGGASPTYNLTGVVCP